MALRNEIKINNLEVNLLCRNNPSTYKNEKYTPFNLGDSLEIDCKGCSIILIHLAHDYYDTTDGKSNVNSIGFNRLLDSFHQCQSLRIIYISTPILDDTAVSRYQEQKLIGEEICSKKDSLILRPSLVFSKKTGINKIFHILSLIQIPIALPNVSAYIAPLSVEKLAKLIVSEDALLNMSGKFLVIGQEKMSFRKYLYRFHNIKSFQINDNLLRWLLFLLKKIPFRYSIYLYERVVGLSKLPEIDKLRESHAEIIL